MPRPLDDYVEVAERVEKFFEKYPEGALEPYPPGDGWKLVQAEGWEAPKDGENQVMQTFIVFTAAAYRHDHDPHPGIGTAWEIFPGRTNFTRGSEMQNAETSAWGRALAALGIETKRGIASREEVRSRQAERDDGLPANRDGSTSRSRVTDQQLADTGQMTRAQAAEHGQLKPPPNSSKVERIRPGDDVGGLAWTSDTNPSASGTSPQVASASGGGANGDAVGFGTTLAPDAHGTPAEDRAGTASAEQIKTIQTLYSKQFKITGRHERVETTRKFLGLDMLASHTQLSYRQAGDLLLAMRHKLSETKSAR